MRLKGGACKGLHPSARVKKVRNVVSGFFAASARFDPLQTPFRPASPYSPNRTFPAARFCLQKALLATSFFVKPVLYGVSFGRFSVGGNGLFSAEAPPKPLGAPLLFLSVFYACQRASPSAAQPLPHFFALSLPILFLTRSPFLLFFSPALPRRRRGRAVRARRRTFFPPRRQRGGKGKLAGEGKGETCRRREG